MRLPHSWVLFLFFAVGHSRTLVPQRSLMRKLYQDVVDLSPSEVSTHKAGPEDGNESSAPTISQRQRNSSLSSETSMKQRRGAVAPRTEVSAQRQLDNFCASLDEDCQVQWAEATAQADLDQTEITYAEFRLKEGKDSCPSPDDCRKDFVEFALSYVINLFFQSFGVDPGTQGLGAHNVVLQAGTAAWYYGCRGPVMTNDMDAWLMPEAGYDLTFDSSSGTFQWGSERTKTILLDDITKQTTTEHKTPPMLQVVTPAYDVPEGDDLKATEQLAVSSDSIAELSPRKGHKLVQKAGPLSRFEIHRSGQIFFYLSSDTKSPSHVIPAEASVFGPSAQMKNSYDRMEYDFYTPLGAMDGDYTWPWLEANQAFKLMYERGDEIPTVRVAPRYLIIVQKVKLYLESLPDTLTRPSDLVDGWHKRVQKGKDDSDTEFLGQNYAKLAQDIKDLQCLCASCEGGEFEVDYLMATKQDELLILNTEKAPNFCFGLCGLVAMIGVKNPKTSASLLPDDFALYQMFSSWALGEKLTKEGKQIPTPEAVERLAPPEIERQLLFMYQQAKTWNINEEFKAKLKHFAREAHAMLSSDSKIIFNFLDAKK